MPEQAAGTTRITLTDARVQALEKELAEAKMKVHYLYKHHLEESRKLKGELAFWKERAEFMEGALEKAVAKEKR